MTTRTAALLTAIALLVAAPVGARAQDLRAWSIEDLVAHALERAPLILAARSREAEARGAAVQAGLRPNPMVALQRREETDTPGHQTSVSVTWPLDLFRRPGRLAVADAEMRFAGGATEQDRWRLATSVRVQAGRVLAAARRLDVARQVADVARGTRDLAAARAETGAAPPLERDQADVAWRRRQAEALRLQGEVEAELAVLKAMAGLDPSVPLTLRDDLESVTSALLAAPPQGTGAAAPDAHAVVAARPDVRLAELSLERASARQALARRLGRFDASLTAAYSRARAGFPQQGLDAVGRPVPIGGRTHSVLVGLNLAWPWRDDNRGAIAAADAAATTAGRVLDARRLDAEAEIEAARQRVAAASETLDLLRGPARDLAARNLEVVRESHALGRASLTDVLEETRRLLELESAYTAALADAYQSRVALIAALGAIQ